ncbi:MAG: metallophosphoesterase family protein, partial [Spirochaetota bacterium]
MIRILLTSDLHLGSKDEDTPVLHRERILTFKKILSLAKDHDLILIAGDLFDSPSPDQSVIDEVSQLVAAASKKGTRILLTPGDKESIPGENSSPLSRLCIDRVFSDDPEAAPYLFEKNGEKLFVYGLPAHSEKDITSIAKAAEEGFHIGLFHTQFDMTDGIEENPLAKIKKKDIKSLALDFYALGHNHSFTLYKYIDKIIGAYPGSPEPVYCNETGDRYVI